MGHTLYLTGKGTHPILSNNYVTQRIRELSDSDSDVYDIEILSDLFN